MRAAGLLPLLLLLLLLLGVRSQDSADLGQATTTRTAEATTTTPPAGPKETTPASTTPTTTTLKPTTTTVTTQTTVSTATPHQSIATTTTTSPRVAPSPTTASPAPVAGAALTASGSTVPAAPPSASTSGQDSPAQSTPNPKTSPATSPTGQQQPSTTASSGSSGTTTAAQSVVITHETNSPGVTGAVVTSTATTESQGKQPMDQDPKPNITTSTTVPRTDSSQSSKECAITPPPCATKQPTPSSSFPAQGPIPSTSPGSTKIVTPPTGSLSPTTTPMSQHGSKDTVPDATTMTAPGADQSTQGAGPASAEPSSASQSPASAQPAAPGDHTDQAESCTSGHPQPNISSSNELICREEVQHTRPSIHLKEPRTCDEWMAASKNNSFFESFCSTAQQGFDASRDWCTVVLTACERPSHHWAVRVVLHSPLDSGEVLMGLMEKKDRLEELGIVNVTSDKMVEDMTIKDEFSTPLIITIITLAGSLLLVAAIYGCHQRLSQKKDQNIHPDVPGFDDGHVALIFNQRLTEEMQTMENGYHDNPTLEVMETSSEMQEKKVNLNGELGDSWIVPLDTLMKEDLEEEEDTHL
ncbi:podocalyxin isoform X1 [Ammospiza nelsoni]|uniref:podocalyxin isoform X1 n=1 Tax=Ammospiza nelsoni TaxID=2857394 RepID=UPI00286CAF25|nr:podocalyxin isoform X1 [Ammospiza nelsoni]